MAAKTSLDLDTDLGRTRMTWRGDFPSAAERDRVIREYGAAQGLVQTMARLDDYVVTLPSTRNA